MKPYYSKKVIDHFLHPRNFGKIKNASGIGDTRNLRCGDVMKLYIKVEKNVITDIKFETMGCGHAISISDIMCDLVKGKTVAQALKVDYNDIIKELGQIPPAKVHCSYLAKSALRAAVEDYKKNVRHNKRKNK